MNKMNPKKGRVGESTWKNILSNIRLPENTFFSRDSGFGRFLYVAGAIIPLIAITSFVAKSFLGHGEIYWFWKIPIVYNKPVYVVGLLAIFGLFAVRWIQKRTDIEPLAKVYKLDISILLFLLVINPIWQSFYQEQDPEQTAKSATVKELRKSDISKEELLIAEAKIYAGDKLKKLETAIRKYRDAKETLLKAEGEIPSWYQIWKNSRSAEANLQVAQNKFAGAKTDLFVLAHGIIAANPGPENFSLTSATNKIKDAVNTPEDFETRPTTDFRIIKHSRRFWEVRFRETDKFCKIFDTRPSNSRILITCPDDNAEIRWKDGSRDAKLPASGIINGLFAQPLFVKYCPKETTANNTANFERDKEGKKNEVGKEKQIFINFVDV